MSLRRIVAWFQRRHEARRTTVAATDSRFYALWETLSERFPCACGVSYEYLTPWLHKHECAKFRAGIDARRLVDGQRQRQSTP